MILGIDGGNYNGKVCTMFGVDIFSSFLGEYRARKIESIWGSDDMVWEYEGEKGFAGTLAEQESVSGSTRKGDTKAHKDAKLRILLAIHRNSNDSANDIVVGQPINRHDPGEKQKIINMLKGHHVITVNGESKRFFIRNVAVGVEGGSAGLLKPQRGEMKIIDIGSGTINFATLYNGIYRDRDSWSERFGLATMKADKSRVARKIVNLAIDQWHEQDVIHLIGGGSELLYDYLKEDLPNVTLLQPEFKGKLLSPTFANAVSFYKIGARLYG